MSLADEIAVVERRAQDQVHRTADDLAEFEPALLRYAAVCKLAGRWEQHAKKCGTGALCQPMFHAELVALVKEMDRPNG